MAYVFIDFDNTLCDQFLLNTQYTREAGALLAQSFGGEEDSWAKAVADTLEALKTEYEARFTGNPLGGYNAWLEEARERSVRMTFASMERTPPPNAAELAKDTQFQALTACDAAYPGAYEALDALFQGDYRVQLASANDSEYLLAALIGAGIESFTESKFGPDLIDCAKEGPEFYERIFEATGVSAEETLVVDDHPETLRWAMSTGAKAIQAKLSTERHYPTQSGVVAVLTDLKDLPDLVRQILG